jgi:predicted enzyme related to lactoylglutathione lyase
VPEAHSRQRSETRTLPDMRHVLVVVSAMLLAVGASPGPEARPAGEFVWHDLLTDNPAASRAFYGALFGWTFEETDGIDPGYTLIRHDGRPLGGIVPHTPGERAEGGAQWLTYVTVGDVDRAAAAFTQAGGRVLRKPMTTRNGVRVAVAADPQGAAIGLTSRSPLIEADASGPPAVHRWLWMEYVARDAAAALTFYANTVGFTHEVSESRENFTYYLLSSGRPRAGLFLSPWPRETSAWLPYIRVADPAAAAARAVELGGTIALPARPGVRGGSLAIVLDPSGAPIALQRFPFQQEVTP